MGLDVPNRYESHIQRVAETQHITTDEALDRILQAGLERFIPRSETNPRRAALFGAAKHGYGSREAVDRAIAEMRDEW